MSGIEVAGLVLGAFPIVVEAIEFYLKGLKAVGRWVKFTRTMENLVRRLKVERVKFQNTCEELLYDLCMSSELQDLLDDPGGPLWQQEYLQMNLRSQLGRSYAPYQDCVAEIRASLEAIKEHLELDENDKPKWSSYKVYKREWKRVRLSLTSPQIEGILDTMAKYQRDLRELCGHRNHLLSSKRHRTPKQAAWYNSRNQMFAKIHELLLASLTAPCRCELSHLVKIRLTTPAMMAGSVTDEKVETGSQDICDALVSFSQPHESQAETTKIKWREIRFRYVDRYQDAMTQKQYLMRTSWNDGKKPSLLDTPVFAPDPARPRSVSANKSVSFALPAQTPVVSTANISARPLEVVRQEGNLCRAFSNNITSITNLGKLDTDENREMTLDSLPALEPRQELISLESLLSNGLHDTRKRRLSMALEVTSGLLQLHNTPWLSASWASHEIFVLLTEHGKTESDYTYVYSSGSLEVSSTSSGPLEMTTTSSLETFVMRNRNLFFLGVILIELWFGKSLNSLAYNKSQEMGLDQSLLTTYRLANSMLDEVYQQAGVWYGDAVRRCVLCDFDQRNTNLSSAGMVEAVHQGVYLPLLQHFKAFCGQSVNV